MRIRDLQDKRFKVGDLVTVRSLGDKDQFCIIGFKRGQGGERLAILKGLFRQTYVTEQPVSELQSLLIRGKL